MLEWETIDEILIDLAKRVRNLRKRKNITEEDLLQVGLENHLDKKKCKDIIEKVKVCVKDKLEKYL